jgi:hypothetical protein
VVVISTGREKRRLTTEALHKFKTKNVPVEGDSTLKVRYLQVDVPDTDLGI